MRNGGDGAKPEITYVVITFLCGAICCGSDGGNWG